MSKTGTGSIKTQIFASMGGILGLAFGIAILTLVATTGLVGANVSANIISATIAMSGFIVILGIFAILKIID